MALTPKQRRFCSEYLIDLNATQAAIRAGYSKRTAKVQGSELLTKPDIRAKVAQTQAKSELKAETVLRELLLLARSDVAQLYDEHGQLKPIHEIPEEARRAIAGIDVEDLFEGRGESRKHVGTIRKIKLWSKPQALELLGKHLKLFTELIHVDLTPHSALILAAAARVKGSDGGET
jgi:phage terminase small subunit